MIKLVLTRHGQSHWNFENKFTGWTDIDLTEKGIAEAQKAGILLAQNGFEFDIAHTSYLKRAIRTLNIVLTQMDLLWLPVHKSWRLNERHYGRLQGLNKDETRQKYGEEQVFIWRRSYDTPPPQLPTNDPRHPSHEARYSELESLPSGESLKTTKDRVMPYWNNEIAPQIKKGKRVLISAHGNSLRALIKHLEGISDEDICKLNIPTGAPLVYELDPTTLAPQKKYFLE